MGKTFNNKRLIMNYKNLSSIEQEVYNCYDCPLASNQEKCKVPGKIPNTKIISVILLSHPSIQEGKLGIPLVDKIGEYINPTLQESAKELDKIAVFHCIKCSPNFTHYPNIDSYELCKHFVKRQLKEIRPLNILVMGAYPLKLMRELLTFPQGKRNTYAIANLRRKPFLAYHPERAALLQITYDPYSTLSDMEIATMKLDIKQFAKVHNELLSL